MRGSGEKKRRGERKGKGEPDVTGLPLQHFWSLWSICTWYTDAVWQVTLENRNFQAEAKHPRKWLQCVRRLYLNWLRQCTRPGCMPGLGRPLEEEWATHASILAWRTHGQRGLAAPVHGVTEVDTTERLALSLRFCKKC